MKGTALLLQSLLPALGIDPAAAQQAFAQLQVALPAVVNALKEMDERTKRIETKLNALTATQPGIARIESSNG